MNNVCYICDEPIIEGHDGNIASWCRDDVNTIYYFCTNHEREEIEIHITDITSTI